MKEADRKRRICAAGVPVMALALALVVAARLSALPVPGQTIRVSTAEQLVRALGPQRTVILEPGVYSLTEAQVPSTGFARWEAVYDGRQLVLEDVVGLTLRAEGPASIVAEPRYAYVLALVRCSEIAIENLTLGHSEAGECTGGVLLLESCEDVRLRGCDLYGSGTVGLDLQDCRRVSVIDSIVRECTYGALWIDGCREVVFAAVQMVDNEAWPLISASGSEEVLFAGCRIAGNEGGALFSIDEDCENVRAPGTFIDGNQTSGLGAEWGLLPDLSEAVFGSNLFDIEGDEYYEEGEYYEEYLDEGEEPEPEAEGGQ